MAPFAVLAPVHRPGAGPAAARTPVGDGRQPLGRAVLALVMLRHFDDLWLYPAALGVLVLSKAHNVLRAAVVPRVLPSAMSLTSANARLSVFGLATAGVAGGVGAGIAATLGFPLGARRDRRRLPRRRGARRPAAARTSTCPPASCRPTC